MLVAGRNLLRGFHTNELRGPGCEAQNGFSGQLWSGDHRVSIPTLQIQVLIHFSVRKRYHFFLVRSVVS